MIICANMLIEGGGQKYIICNIFYISVALFDQSMMADSRVVEFDDLTEKSLVNSLKRVLFQ